MHQLRTGRARILTAGGVITALLVCLPARVDAYIDPGTGSYVFQIAAAGLFAALYTLKRFWRAIQSAIRWQSGTRLGERDSDTVGRDGME